MPLLYFDKGRAAAPVSSWSQRACSADLINSAVLFISTYLLSHNIIHSTGQTASNSLPSSCPAAYARKQARTCTRVRAARHVRRPLLPCKLLYHGPVVHRSATTTVRAVPSGRVRGNSRPIIDRASALVALGARASHAHASDFCCCARQWWGNSGSAAAARHYRCAATAAAG